MPVIVDSIVIADVLGHTGRRALASTASAAQALRTDRPSARPPARSAGQQPEEAEDRGPADEAKFLPPPLVKTKSVCCSGT